MSYETSAFQDEIDKLDQRITSLKQKGTKLRKFILSTKFLEATNKFLDLLGEFEDEVITLVEAIQAPVPGVPPYEAKAAPEEEGKEEAEGFGKRRRRR